MNKLTLAYSTDDKFVPFAMISAVSALRRHEANSVRIYILGNNISEENAELMRKTIEKFSGEFHLIDVSEKLAKLEESGVNKYTSISTYARLYIADFLTEVSGRILYIDCDTLVNAPLTELFACDLRGKAFALGYDWVHVAYRTFIRLNRDSEYFNSGIMLIDLDQWRKLKYRERCENHIKNIDSSKNYIFPDQDLLNVEFHNEIAILPAKYNVLTTFLLYKNTKSIRFVMGLKSSAPWISEEEFSEARDNPVIYHFAGNSLGRPWQRNSHHPMAKKYAEIAKIAGFENALNQPSAIPLIYKIQTYCFRFLPNFLFTLISSVSQKIFIYKSYKVW